MTKRRFRFRYPEWREIDAHKWVTWRAGRYGDGDNPQYFGLIERIEKKEPFSAEDFDQIGRWKEGCPKPDNGRWKTGTPVAYDVWMEAKKELPKCPDATGITAFLMDWSERTFVAGGDKRKKTFGLSRATTLLHFVSVGEFPILDRRVVTAMMRLGSPIDEAETIGGYLNSFCPLFSELADVCGLSGLRGRKTLDNALFNYGAETSFPSSPSAPSAL